MVERRARSRASVPPRCGDAWRLWFDGRMSGLQEYVRARSVQEAVALKTELGVRAFYLAGGTDALVFVPPSATTAIDIMHLGLDVISSDNGSINIGATVLLRDIERDSRTASIADGA